MWAKSSGSAVSGSVTKMSLGRGNFGFRLDADFRYDFLFWRHLELAIRAALDFKANVVHITGPNDAGQLGALVAHRLRLPLVISWHTNIHEYAARRLNKLTAALPISTRDSLSGLAERLSLCVAMRFYRLGRALLAPNEELRDLLESQTGRPTHLMRRGVDTTLFSPSKRSRAGSEFLIGYVGRLTPEKNVRWLAELERELICGGRGRFSFFDRRRRKRTRMAGATDEARGIHRCAARRGARLRIREPRSLRLPFTNRHFRKCRAGSAGVRRALSGQLSRRPEVDYSNRRS